ncbi:MAG: DUF1958 domain-containing protein, partial [Erysipelotrichia bacterium]|nr:DUF1958 domain-containing protein [Erysipelotrichia bacterium]
GYTKLAKRTLVTTSKQKDTQIVVVTLNASDDFQIHEQLHEKAYAQYESIKLINKGNYNINNHRYQIEEDVYQTIRKGEKKKVKMAMQIKGKRLIVKIKYDDLYKEYAYE